MRCKYLLLTLLLCCWFSHINAQTFNIEGVNYSLTTTADGETTAKVVSGDYKGVVIIPESIIYNNQEINVSIIGSRAFQDAKDLKTVILPSTIKKIEDAAFQNCTNILKLNLNDGLTSIGEWCFSNCYGISSLDIPETVDSIGRYAFRSCIKLQEITLPSKLRTISEGMLYGCKTLQEIDIPKGLQYVNESALDSCSSLTEIILPSTLKKFPRSFPKCYNLSKISMDGESPLFKVDDNVLYKVNKDDSWTFWFCPTNKPEGLRISDKVLSLTDQFIFRYIQTPLVEIPSSVIELSKGLFSENYFIEEVIFNASVSTIPANLFSNCSNLKILSINSNVVEIAENALSYCRNLERVILPSTLEVIGKNCFTTSRNLNSLELPYGLKRIEEKAFYNCTGLTEINLPPTLESLGVSVFERCSKLEKITIPEKIDNIADCLFIYCSSLAEINIESKSPTFGQSAFAGTAISKIELPEETKQLGAGLFSGCTNLESIEIPSSIIQIPSNCFSGSGLSYVKMGEQIKLIDAGAFSNCKNLEEIDLTLLNANVKLNYSAFYGCENLRKVILPKKLISISDSLFANCTNLEEIGFPEDLLTIGNGAFSNTGLKNVVFPEFLLEIGENSFANCKALTQVKLNDLISEIPTGAFKGCANLSKLSLNEDDENLNLPNTITSIGDYAFYGTGFDKIVLSEDIKEFGSNTFRNCEKLETFVLSDKIVEIPEQAFKGCKSLTNICSTSTINNSPGFNIPEQITIIGKEAFASCGFTKIVIPSQIQTLDVRVFADCKDLVELELHENFKGDIALEYQKDDYYLPYEFPLSDGAFYGCSNLMVVKSHPRTQPKMYFGMLGKYKYPQLIMPLILIPKNCLRDYPNWSDPIGEYYGSGHGVIVECDNFDTYKYYYDGSMVYHFLSENSVEIAIGAYRENKEIELNSTVSVDGKSYKIVGIGDYAFSCSQLKPITLPEYLEYVGEYPFNQWWSALEIRGDLPKSLKTFHFNGCRFKDEIHIPEGIVTLNDGAFESNYWADEPTILEKGLWLNDELRKISWLYAQINTINIGKAPLDQTDFNYSFGEIKGLSTIQVDKDNEFLSVYENVLYDKHRTRLLFYPTGIEQSEFSVPLGVKVIESQFNRSYYQDENYISVFNIPVSVDSITASSKWDVVYCAAMTPPAFAKVKNITIDQWHKYSGNTLYVPKGTREAYQNAQGWDFKSIIEADFEIPKFTITYMVEDKIYYQETVEYNSVITPCDAPEDLPSGVTFLGWEDFPEKMPPYDIVVNAKLEYDAALGTILTDENTCDVYTLEGILLYKNLDKDEIKARLPKGMYIIRTGNFNFKFIQR